MPPIWVPVAKVFLFRLAFFVSRRFGKKGWRGKGQGKRKTSIVKSFGEAELSKKKPGL